MNRLIGTMACGLRAPIVQKGDDVAVMVDALVGEFWAQSGVVPRDRDVVAITESVVGRAQGNYASIDQIAADVHAKFGNNDIGIIFPITSRNRFAICLRGFAKAAALGGSKIIIMLSYPADEVGNSLCTSERLEEAGVNPWQDRLEEEEMRRHCGEICHQFTGVDYIAYYKGIVEEYGVPCRMVFANQAEAILEYTEHVLYCDIHTRERTRRRLKENGAKTICGMADILRASVNGSGFNPDYGLLGSNKATEDSVKLFPRDCQPLVLRLQEMLQKRSGKLLEVMVYGDGAFRDPVGQIWELADPVVAPGFTPGLAGLPNEVKLKYLADDAFAGLTGQALEAAIVDHIRRKPDDLIGCMASQGTTPRQLPDLIGSLCDLTSGSGDKGTPVVYVQGYFDNYAS